MKFTLDVTHDEYARYKQFLKRDKPRYKVYRDGFIRCPACDYVVDNCVPCQNFCDRCGQRLVDAGYFNSNKKADSLLTKLQEIFGEEESSE